MSPDICPFCGSPHYKESKIEGFLVCRECMTDYKRNRTTEDKRNWIHFQQTMRLSIMWHIPFTKKRRLIKQIKELKRDAKTALDIGCGGGEFVAALKRYGIQTSGIDMHEGDVQHAKENDLDVYKGTFPDDIPPELQKKYDIISMIEVIYYFPDIKKTLLKAYEMLSDRGIIIIKFRDPYGIKEPIRHFGSNVQALPFLMSVHMWLSRTGFVIERIMPMDDKSAKRTVIIARKK